MASRLSAIQIAEQALQLIGAYSTADTAADPEELRRALAWLDIDMGQLAGETRLWWLVTDTLSIALTLNVATYDLRAALGAAWPADGFLFPVDAWLEDASANRYPLEIVHRDEMDATLKPSQSGTPREIHIDRRIEGMDLRLWPVPASGTWTIKLVVHTFSKSVADREVSGLRKPAGNDHGLRITWQRWAIYQVAADIGSGPVRRIAVSDREHFRDEANRAKAALLAFENREHQTTPPVIDGYDPDYIEFHEGARVGAYGEIL